MALFELATPACQAGQELIHEIVNKTQELFNILKTNPASSDNERKAKDRIKELLDTVSALFGKLRQCYDKVNESCAGLSYIQAKSLVPFKDDPEGMEQIQSHRRNMSSEVPVEVLRERDELIAQLQDRDDKLRHATRELRNFVFELNTMMAMSKERII